MNQQLYRSLLTAASLCALCACSSDTDPRTYEREQAFLANLVQESILPLYDAAYLRASELKINVDELCESPSSDGVALARASWRALQDAWKHTEVYSFGPVKEYPLRLGPKIDLWPARAETVERAIRDGAWKEVGDLSVVSGWSKGLPAVEYVLFRDPDASVVSDELTAEVDRCTYLGLLAEDARINFELLVNAWKPDDGNFAAELTFDQADVEATFFGTVAMAFDEVMNRTGFLIELMRQTKVAKPAGIATGTIDLGLAESRFCDCSLEDLQANLAGLREVYVGAAERASSSEPAEGEVGEVVYNSIRSLLPQDAQSIDVDILASFDELELHISGFETTLTGAIDTNPSRVEELYQKLTRLQVLFQVDLFQALGVTLTFNDNDGD